MSKNLVIVESPAKAKTIKKYLGKDFEVLASYGHVRDLVPKEGAVNPDADFAMKYQLIERNSKHVDAIAKALKKADNLYLATDPDREGEAISWHLHELLKDRKSLKDKGVRNRRSGRRGHQYVELQVVLPEADEPELETFLKDWKPRKAQNPRKDMLK